MNFHSSLVTSTAFFFACANSLEEVLDEPNLSHQMILDYSFKYFTSC